MKRIIALVASSAGMPYTKMAAEALKKVSVSQECDLKIEMQDTVEFYNGLSAEAISAADMVIIAADTYVEMIRFAGKTAYVTTPAEAIRNTKNIFEIAVELAGVEKNINTASIGKTEKKFVAVTACMGGIAHTFMAAMSLEKAAKALGYEIKVETQSAAGVKNSLFAEEIAAADAVVIAAETTVDIKRFYGKSIYVISPKHAIYSGQEVLTTALEQPAEEGKCLNAPKETIHASPSNTVPTQKPKMAGGSLKVYSNLSKHLLTGVSYMLPMVIAGGISIALAFAVGGIYASEQKESTLAGGLSLIGSGIAFQLFVAMLSGFIAFSIADRPGLTPGLIGGMLAQHLGTGFLGGIVSGFLAGYLTKFLIDKIRLPVSLNGLKSLLILPCLSSILVGLIMIHLLSGPIALILNVLTEWLRGMQGTNAVLLGLLLGGMMAFDMGGPINKVACTFAIGLLASKVYTPMAAVMAAGMTPPLGIAVATWIFKNRFDPEDRKAAGSAFVLGLSYVTEGAIPYAAKDPLRVIPAIVIGSAVSGAVSMFCSVNLLVPHGGIFTTLIPGAIENLACFFIALMAGTIVTASLLFLLKKPFCGEQHAAVVMKS